MKVKWLFRVKSRLLLIAVLLSAFAVAGTVLPSTAHASGGGGCNYYNSRSTSASVTIWGTGETPPMTETENFTYDIWSCINIDQNYNENADAYFSLFYSHDVSVKSCVITMTIYDYSGHKRGSRDSDCRDAANNGETGFHASPASVWPQDGDYGEATIKLSVDYFGDVGGFTPADSPPIYP